jgi:hypothetical protein
MICPTSPSKGEKIRMESRRLFASGALLVVMLSASATPALASGPAPGSARTNVETRKFAMSNAECAALHQQHPAAECSVVVTVTVPTGGAAQGLAQEAAPRSKSDLVVPLAAATDSPCKTHNYFSGTAQAQAVGGGAWSYTLWIQYRGDKVCGNVQYQTVRCYLDWGILWSASTSGCSAVPAINKWAWWGDPSYAYADYAMTYSPPIIGGVFSIGHRSWIQVNGMTGKVGWGV